METGIKVITVRSLRGRGWSQKQHTEYLRASHMCYVNFLAQVEQFRIPKKYDLLSMPSTPEHGVTPYILWATRRFAFRVVAGRLLSSLALLLLLLRCGDIERNPGPVINVWDLSTDIWDNTLLHKCGCCSSFKPRGFYNPEWQMYVETTEDLVCDQCIPREIRITRGRLPTPRLEKFEFSKTCNELCPHCGAAFYKEEIESWGDSYPCCKGGKLMPLFSKWFPQVTRAEKRVNSYMADVISWRDHRAVNRRLAYIDRRVQFPEGQVRSCVGLFVFVFLVRF